VVSELTNVLTYGQDKVYRVWENDGYYRIVSEFTLKLTGLAVPEFAYTALDQAMHEFVERKAPLSYLRAEHAQLYWKPYTADERYQVSVNNVAGKTYLIVLGGSDCLSRHCTKVMVDQATVDYTEK
jgi:hypothetical protein